MFYIFISYSRIDQMPDHLMHTQVSNLTFRDCLAQMHKWQIEKHIGYAPGSYRPTCDFHFPAVFSTDEHAKTTTHFFKISVPHQMSRLSFPINHSSEMGLNSDSLLQSCPYNSQVTSAVFCELKSSQWLLSHQSQLVMIRTSQIPFCSVIKSEGWELFRAILCFQNPLPRKQKWEKQLDFNLPVKYY